MAELKARFSLIDEMSDKLTSIAEIGKNMFGQWESTNNSLNMAMETAASGASNIITGLNGVSGAIGSVNSASSSAISGTNMLSESVNSLGSTVNTTSQVAEQFAEENSKIANVLSSESDIISKCEQATMNLNSEAENALSVHRDLTNSFKQSTASMREYAESGKLSLESQRELVEVWEDSNKVLIKLEDTQYNVKKAEEYYNSVIKSGTEDIKEYEIAKSRLEQTTEYVAETILKAKDSVSQFSDALNNTIQSESQFEFANERVAKTAQNLGMAITHGVMEMNYWTDKSKNYDKEALAFSHTVEQLVQKRFMSAEALKYEGSAMSNAANEINKLEEAGIKCVSVNDELANTIAQTKAQMVQYADSGKLSSESMECLESTGKNAEQAMRDLETAQKQMDTATTDLKNAMSDYSTNVQKGVTDTSALESALSQASRASENLSTKENIARKAVEEFSNVSKEAGESVDENSKKSIDAFEALADTVIAKKIADTVRDIAKAAYELADAFSEAERTVVNATGATGEALSGLEQSMMNAYSGHHQDLSTTSGAIGEINTRMALTGDELTDVTGLFLDYSTITGSDVVGSVQNVTKVMNQWGVEMDSVESVLDKLAYAGQISGISVDTLSSTLITGAASFQEIGLSLDSAIQLLADFELAGINSSTAITAMRTAVNNFTNDGKNAETELQNVIAKIASMGDSTEATALAVDTFGSKAGQQLAAAIRSGTVSVDSFNTSLESADGTLRKTAEAGETMSEKWETSSNKMKAAFTSVLQPSIDDFSSSAAELIGKAGDFLNEHPALVEAITAIGVGIGVATIATTGYVFVTKVAINAITKFGTALQSAMGPIGWISAAATLLVGGLSLLADSTSESQKEVAAYTGTLEQCHAELENAKAQHDAVVTAYGEENSAAKELEKSISTLEKQYEQGGGAAADYTQRINENAVAISELKKSYDDQVKSIEDSYNSGIVAVSMLESLSSQSKLTNDDLDIMSKYADYLNDTFHCNIQVDYEKGKLLGFDPEDAGQIVIEQAEQNRKNAALDSYTSTEWQDKYITAYQNFNGANTNYENVLKEYRLAADEFSKAYEDYVDVTTTPGKYLTDDIEKVYDSAKEKYDSLGKELYGNKYQSTVSLKNGHSFFDANAIPDYSYTEEEKQVGDAGLYYAQQEASNGLNDVRNQMEGLAVTAGQESTFSTYTDWLEKVATGAETVADNTKDVNEEITNGVNSAKDVIEEYTDPILELSEAYDEAYNSALESMQGQFGLFDEASMESEAYMSSTVANAQEALNSQLEYWKSYGENIEYMKNVTAEDLGVTQQQYDAFMEYVRTGTPEAAGLINDMVLQAKDGNLEVVTDVIQTQGQIAELQDDIATDIGEWSTGIDEEMQKFYDEMTKKIDELDLSTEAQASASCTMTAYITAISLARDKAKIEAQSVVDAVRGVFENANLSFTARGISGYVSGGIELDATGTTNSADVFIAGENGPELIVGKAGSTVFPTSETNRIISAVSNLDGGDYTSNSSYFNSNQTTEIINNYRSVQGSSYDDTKVVSLLERMDSTFTSMAREMGSIDTSYTTPDTINIESIEVIVDLSVFDSIISKFNEVYYNLVEDNSVLSEAFNSDSSFRIQNDDNRIIAEDEISYSRSESREYSENVSRKEITIKIEGSEPIIIKSNSNISEEEVIEIMLDNLRPAVINMVNEEIFEEGENSYEY